MRRVHSVVGGPTCARGDDHGKLDVSRQLVHLWRERHTDFPQPIAKLGGDLDTPQDKRRRKVGVLVWNWPDIEKWARTTGRYPPKPDRDD